eukprot:9282015-Pyramimonas_sp.AAC.1
MRFFGKLGEVHQCLSIGPSSLLPDLGGVPVRAGKRLRSATRDTRCDTSSRRFGALPNEALEPST